MNLEQHLLIKFDEECSETAEQVLDLIAILNGFLRQLTLAGKRTTKALRFTLEECEPGQRHSNGNRLCDEIKDIYAAVSMMEERGIIPRVILSEADLQIRKNRFQKYLIHSANNGTFKP